MRTGSRQLVFALFLVTLVCHVSTVAAFPHVWFSGTSGDFDDPGRWVPMSVPGPADDVYFLQSSSYIVTFPSETTVVSNSLNVQAGNVAFQFLDMDSTYSITNDAVLGIVPSGLASLTVNDGVLNVGGQFDILNGATLFGNLGARVSAGGSLNIANGGGVRGRIEIGSGLEVNNHGLIAPGALPGTGNEFGTIFIVGNGNFQQFADGTLEIQIRPMGMGLTHDSIVYTDFSGVGSAILGGRLSVPFIDGYVPQLNNSFSFVHTGGLPGNSIIGQFDSLSLPGNTNGLAARIDYMPTTTSITFVAPMSVGFNSGRLTDPPPGPKNWSDPLLWDQQVPDSTSTVNIVNQENVSGQIDVILGVPGSENAFVHQASLGGTTNDMSLRVHEGTNFTAVESLNVNNHGVLALDGGTVHSKLVTVNSGGSLIGSGFIDGNVELGVTSGPQRATLSPGFSTGEITFEENLTLGPNVDTMLEIFADDDFDMVHVVQDANLGGTLVVDIENTLDLEEILGVPFAMLSAGDVISEFNDVVLMDDEDDYFIDVDYSANEVAMILCGDGDMNYDENYDSEDVRLFALGLTNPLGPLGYYSEVFELAEDGGDMNDDGFFDFDDIEEFSQIDFDGGLMAEDVIAYLQEHTGIAVPEPTAALLIVAGSVLMTGTAGRELRNRSSMPD